MKTTRTLSILAAGAVLVVLTAACSSGATTEIIGPGNAGQVTVELAAGTTAAPATAASLGPVSSIASAEITLSSVRAFDADGEAYDLTSQIPNPIDLMDLVANGAAIAAGVLPPGTYTALEVTITGASITAQDGTVVDITLPPGGVTVTVLVSFEVVDGEATTVKLRLEVELSFEMTSSGVVFRPEIEVEGVEHRH